VHASVTIDIDAPPERVWAVMVDVEAWPQWTASVTEAARLDTGHFDVGSRARLHQPRLPVAVWTVEDVEPGRSFTWTTGLPGFRTTGRHLVERRRDGSRATLEIEQRGLVGELVGRCTAGLTDRYLNLEALGLKRRSEEPPAGPDVPAP
jgi:uncharacterized protein YndB with AHSA1/START domain